jgi:hypothetical protein
MELKGLPRPVLRATVCEIERGLFQVSYQTDAVEWAVHALPKYQVGASAPDAKQRIEQRAQQSGFGLVVWEEALVATALFSEPAVEIASPLRGVPVCE